MNPYSNTRDRGDKYARKSKKVQSREDVERARKKRARQEAIAEKADGYWRYLNSW